MRLKGYGNETDFSVSWKKIGSAKVPYTVVKVFFSIRVFGDIGNVIENRLPALAIAGNRQDCPK